jgi:hypothetical protein
MSMDQLEISEAEPIRKTDSRWRKTWPQHLAASLGKVPYYVYFVVIDIMIGSRSFVSSTCHAFVSVN